MDTIYSNKKYLQSLNAADYYRASTTLRPMANDYASYQNTMSRRSLFGAYSHQQPNMSKYSYPSDVSLSSHYGYTSWGLWRDTGNLSPSIYSKKRINIRSFSILIMSAAFIVLLAVLSVAALAFYFSTFKSDPAESTLVFDCIFRVTKGDVFTSGLKYNHTTAFRQKAAFYTRFIESSLEHASFNVAKTDINSFGNGPDLLLDFRIYLDMRKIQMTITNVEEHIKNAFISEIAYSDSAFRSLKIDTDTIEIKRQLDPEVLRQASLFGEQLQETTAMPTTVIPLDELASSKKLITSTEKVKLSKLSTMSTTVGGTSKFTNSKRKDSPKPIQESDIDMENLPVIQGSFEITKTDADIAQKRSEASQRPSTASLTPNTLKPFFISPVSSIKIKSNEKQSSTTVTSATKVNSNDSILEMFLQHQKQQIHQKIKEPIPVTAKIEKTNKNGETTVTKAVATSTTTTSERPLSTSESTIITSTPSSSIETTEAYKIPLDYVESQINKDLPKLDVSLFTSAPVLDNEPWRPINPSPSQIKTNFPTLTTDVTLTTSSSTESPIFKSPFNNLNPLENVMYRNKFADPEPVSAQNDTNDSVFYQSFYNPDFSAGDLAIEKLGIADVKPYPLPVNKLDLSEYQNVSPNFKPNDDNDTDDLKLNYDEDKFEHLGGGVIAKKPEANETFLSANDTLKIIHEYKKDDDVVDVLETKNATEMKPTAEVEDTLEVFSDFDEKNGNLIYNKTTPDELESRITPDDSMEEDDYSTELPSQIASTTSTERLNFMNMKDFIVQMQKNKSDEDDSFELPSSTTASTFEMISSTRKPTTNFVEVETIKYTPTSVTMYPTTTGSTIATPTAPQLFPGTSKWEFVNGTRANATETSATRKVFNETLQAVIVENSQTTPHASRIDDLKANRTVDKANLQQLSSIFDTLAAKLGIKPDVASKTPPFSQHSQNKLKNSNNRTRTPSTTTKKTKVTTTGSKRPTTTTTTKLPLTKVTTTRKTTLKPSLSTASMSVPSSVNRLYETSSEMMIGQAEVEAVDPTKYEEILSLISSSPYTRITSTTPSLVTLLPVKSNSGIRNINRIKLPPRPQQPLGDMRNIETVVKTSMSFDS